MGWQRIVAPAAICVVAGLGFIVGREVERSGWEGLEPRSSLSSLYSTSLPDTTSFTDVARPLEAGQSESGGALTLGSAGRSPLNDEPDLGPRQYLRVTRDTRREPLALESSVVMFRPQSGSRWDSILGKGGSVSLIGAIHIGEPTYYRQINDELARYDRVLYEMVGPRGVRPHPKRTHSKLDILSGFQYFLTDYFGMIHQVDGVDYSPHHFVHADLSMEDLVAEGKRRGESVVSIAVGILSDMVRTYNQLSRDQNRASSSRQQAITADSSPPAMLRQFAEVMVSTGGQGIGETLEPYLIDVRNAEALRVLQRELRAGARNVAIFYGAAHLPKMEEELRRKFGLIPVAERWVRAWDLQARRGERVEDGKIR